MDVLIKGLALPKKGTVELTIYEDGHVLYEQDDGRYIEMGDGIAIELPPHGELIEKSNVIFNLQVEALGIEPKDKDFEGIKKGLLLARKAVMDTKPVIDSGIFVEGMPKKRIQRTENLKMAEQIVKERNIYGTDN